MTETASTIIVVSTSQKPGERLVALVNGLAERGDEVHLFTTAPDSWQDLGLAPEAHLQASGRRERQHLVPRIERVLVHRIPRVVSRVGNRMAAARPQGWVGRAGSAAATAQQRVSGAIHDRLYMPGYRQVRPLVTAWAFKPQLRKLNLPRVDRIVAADPNCVPFASQLAKRYPRARATSSLRLD